MKRTILIVGLLLLSHMAEAIPCGTLLDDLDVRTYSFLHAPPSTRKPLLVAAFQRSVLPSALQKMLGNGAIVNNAFSVTDIQFTPDATPSQIGTLQEFKYAATVSLATAPDQCFLVWFSDFSMDLNTIMTQDQSGALTLGSNNKADLSVYMTLNPPGARR